MNETQSVIDLPVDQVMHNPDNPRKLEDDLELLHLGNSMKEITQQQPANVFRSPPGAPAPYTVASGNRRLAAAKLVGMRTIKAIIVPGPNEGRSTILGVLAENRARKGLSTIEDVEAIARAKQAHPELTSKQLAQKTGYLEAEVSKLLTIKACLATVAALHDGRVKGLEAAYTIAKADAAAKDGLIALHVSGATVKQLGEAAKPKPKRETVKVDRVKLIVPGCSLTLAGNDLDTAAVLKLLTTVREEVQRADKTGVSIDSLARVLADRSRATADKSKGAES